MYYTDSFTMALAFTFLVILGVKWLTLNRKKRYQVVKPPQNLAADLRMQYLAALEHLTEDPYNELLLDRCYQLGHKLYDRTIISDEVMTITSQSREKIDSDIQGIYNSLNQKAA